MIGALRRAWRRLSVTPALIGSRVELDAQIIRCAFDAADAVS